MALRTGLPKQPREARWAFIVLLLRGGGGPGEEVGLAEGVAAGEADGGVGGVVAYWA